jgi:hypothetical protein
MLKRAACSFSCAFGGGNRGDGRTAPACWQIFAAGQGFFYKRLYMEAGAYI